MQFKLGHNVHPRIYLWKQCTIHVTKWISSEATPLESTDIIVLEALLEAERDGVAAMNEVILIMRLEIMQLAARIMQANQAVEEVRKLHLEKE